MSNNKQTSARVATSAAKILRSPTQSVACKKVAGSALAQTKAISKKK